MKSQTKKSNSRTPIGETYMHRRLPEVHLSPTHLVSLQNAWVPLGQFTANRRLFFVFSMTTMCIKTLQMIRSQPGQRISLTSLSSLRIEQLDLPLPQGRFALPQSLRLPGSPATSSLVPWTATTRTISISMDLLATVAVASVTST